jgi:hypothetical protein
MNVERAKAAFNIRELTYLLDGGEKSTLVKIKANEFVMKTYHSLYYL